MKRLLTVLVLAALVGFVLFKASVWWLADQRMAEARQALGDSGVFLRGKISSGLDGSLTLSDASWQDFELTQPLVVGRAEFQVGSPGALLGALTTPSDLPASWSLQAEGLILALESSMFRNWVTETGVGGSEQSALFSLSCAPDMRQKLSSGDFLRMGITELKGELALTQSPDGVHLELNTENTGSLELNWPGARIRVTSPKATLTSSDQPLELTLRDGGLMRRVAAYCAREAGMETSQWAGQTLEAFTSGLEARGWEASSQLQALYRQWLLEGGEVTVFLKPGAKALGIPVRSESSSKTGQGSEDPAPEIKYNGARVPDVFLRQIAPEVTERPPEVLEPVISPGVSEGARWQTEDIESASAWEGRTVRVTLANGNRVEGRLTTVTERELEIAREVAGGEVAYPIMARAIAVFEVWKRDQTR